MGLKNVVCCLRATLCNGRLEFKKTNASTNKKATIISVAHVKQQNKTVKDYKNKIRNMTRLLQVYISHYSYVNKEERTIHWDKNKRRS